MRHLTLIAVLFVAGRSAAQPAGPPETTEPGRCEVKIVRAPEDARREIESWVAREPACKIALDVRVIPTEGGLYLLARESTGRLHERLVPDAQAAGVLVASWVADDALEPTPSPPLPPAPRTAQSAESELPPNPLLARALATRTASAGRRWGLGVTVLPGDTGGTRVRGTLDFVHQDGLAAGLVVGGGYSDYEQFFMEFRRIDTRALLGLSWTAGSGIWRLRMQAAAGAVWSHVMRTGETPAGNWVAIPFEASVTFAYHMSDEWAVGIAPIGTAYQRVSLSDSNAALNTTELGVLLELRRGP